MVVLLASTALEYSKKFNDWKIKMADVEAVFLNAADHVYNKMPDEGAQRLSQKKGRKLEMW